MRRRTDPNLSHSLPIKKDFCGEKGGATITKYKTKRKIKKDTVRRW
jgi:hypothetical protein